MALIGFADKVGPPVPASWLNAVDRMLNGQGTPGPGSFSQTFNSGNIPFLGPPDPFTGADLLQANVNFQFGTSLPNPTGNPLPCLLLGSNVPTAGIITDAVLSGTPGINLFMAAGAAAPGSGDLGGNLTLYGGASSQGQAGAVTLQGGTSQFAQAGHVYLQGGNNTNNTGAAGNVYIIGGTTGLGGGSIHLIMTNTGQGTAGSLVFRANSNVLYTMQQFGDFYIGNQGAGQTWQMLMSGGPGASMRWANALQGTSNVTVSGGLSVPVIGVMNWAILGHTVHVWLPPGSPGIIGASNANTNITVTGLPSFLFPATASQWAMAMGLINGGLSQGIGMALVNPQSAGGGFQVEVIGLSGGSAFAFGNSWATSGNKGLGGSFSCWWGLDT